MGTPAGTESDSGEGRRGQPEKCPAIHEDCSKYFLFVRLNIMKIIGGCALKDYFVPYDAFVRVVLILCEMIARQVWLPRSDSGECPKGSRSLASAVGIPQANA